DDRAAREADPARRRRPAFVHAAIGTAMGARRPGRRPSDPDLPLSASRRPAPGRRLRPRPLRPYARRADLRPVSRREAAPRTSVDAVQPRSLPHARRDAACLGRARHHVSPSALLRAAGGDRARPRLRLMPPRVTGLTGATLETAPSVCHECVWWQSRSRPADKRRWISKAEEEWGAWGTVYHDADGRLLGSMQYGPVGLFPRAAELPAGPPSSDSVLITCAYVVDAASPWVMQSLFLAAIGGAKDRGAKALEAFAYRYREGETTYERFLVHRTVFPSDFLADFGFRTV